METRKIYTTNIVLAAGILVIYLLFRIDWLLYLSLGVLTISASSHLLATWIARAWMEFGKLLGNINAKIILSICFFFIIVPISLIRKLSSKSENSKTSNWHSSENQFKTDFTKPW